MRRYGVTLLLAAWLGFGVPAQAVDPRAAAPNNPAQALLPVDPATVERAVATLLANWNSPWLAASLAPDFPYRDRLLAALASAPVDARLELLSVGGVQTLGQERVDGALVSLVRARARVVLLQGGRRSESSIDLILRLRRQAPRS